MTLLRAMWASLLILVAPAGAHAACEGRDIRADLNAQERAEVAEIVAQTPYATGRYFEVEKNGARSVILGTMHSGGPGVTLPPGIAAEIETARGVMLEVTSDAMEKDLLALMSQPDLFLNSAGPFLLPQFSTEEWQVLTGALAETGMPRLLMNQLEPWVVNVMLMIPPCSAHAGPGIDSQVEKIALTNAVQVSALETLDDVVHFLMDDPFDRQIGYIRMQLPFLSDRDAAAATMARMYSSGDIMEIWAINRVWAQKSFGAEQANQLFDDVWAKLLVERNGNWMKKLLPELAQGGVVVAVGALHLPSEDGLLRLLEREGFTVRAIPE